MTETTDISHGYCSISKDARPEQRMKCPFRLVKRQHHEDTNTNPDRHECLPLVPAICDASPAQTDQNSGRPTKGHQGACPVEDTQLAKRDILGRPQVNSEWNGKQAQCAENEVEIKCPGPVGEVHE